ncbi:hypothetical protein N7492_010512 [Penicillium capsulatum]|uniref:N-acetyltransferase domain-containing protein n=1 Tax=Penicillium capsulatum TaxID=69766 RepID=A0A9W9HP84_9EURO|nr:hypothetical protein N7492_010512 [Penicillium capsulatum]KAJ6113014.1 hypothetical protein N7512_008338 [Penicillium capsulatum]
MSLPVEAQYWRRPGFILSTNKDLLSIPAINHAFDQSFMYWVQPVPEDILQTIVDNSFCFGLYETINDANSVEASDSDGEFPPELKKGNYRQIGFARLVTDGITLAYLTDLYVLPTYQGLGLGGWIIHCVDEVVTSLPYLRWMMLRTSSEKSQLSYEKKLGMTVLGCSDVNEGPVMMGRKGNAGRA